jgi:hypothetical protein
VRGWEDNIKIDFLKRYYRNTKTSVRIGVLETVTKRQKCRLEGVEMLFLRAVSGYLLIHQRRDEDMREQLQILDINSRIKD